MIFSSTYHQESAVQNEQHSHVKYGGLFVYCI